PEQLEANAKAMFCTRMAPESNLGGVFTPARQEVMSAALLYEKLQRLQSDRPLLISGVVYDNPATIPNGSENEYAYGIMDLILLSNGVSVDLASGNYDDGLSEIGRLVTVKLNLITSMTLNHANVI